MDLIEAQVEPGPRHPWETSRFWFFRRIIASCFLPKAQTRILDLGAGDTWFSRALLERHPLDLEIHCLDLHYPDEFLARSEGVHPRLTHSRQLPPGATFDGVLLLDVLEHAEDDLGLLSSALELLEPGGWALVSVPAWPSLYTQHDAQLKHVRRYSRQALQELLHHGGLIPLRGGGLFMGLLPIRAAQKLIECLQSHPAEPGPALWKGGTFTTRLIHALLTTDAWVCEQSSRLGIPAPGLSWWQLCRKP